MKFDLLSLTWDTQFLIFLRLPLSAIASLRKTCKRLNEMISKDKQLWMRILDRDVLSQNINLHPLRTPLESASAVHVESWVRCAIHLHHAHREGMLPLVTRIKLDLRVTWLRIIRTCWCLVASSSENESRLSIWNLRRGGSLCKEYYLPGPVVDGVLDDDGTDVMVALTIGTKDMYVSVLSVCTAAGEAAIVQLAILRDVSYVRSLNGPWIVCAVRNGDDTYPTLVHWKNNCSWILNPLWYIERAHLPWGILHCAVCSATQWLDWIILVMAKSVEIFRVADFEGSKTKVDSIASLPIVVTRSYAMDDSDESDVEEASFHSSQGCKTSEGRAILSFSCRIKNGLCSLFSIVSLDSGFSIHQGYIKDLESSDELLSGGSKLVSGLASNYEVLLRTEGSFVLLPNLTFVKVDRNVSESAFVGAAHLSDITEGFPLLHFTTSMDFDDGVGLLALGTCKGYLCFARFLPEEMVAIGSIIDELPTRKNNDEELSVIPVEMDIPPYYSHVQKSKKDFDLPLHIIEEIVKTWPSLESAHLSPGHWSDDWLHYEDIRHWVVPAERWPLNDTGGFYFMSYVSIIRLALSTFGDMIPIAYRRDPDVVIFRVGPRFYMVWIYKLVEEDDLEFIYGALPTSSERSALGGEVLENLRQSGVRDNLKRFGNRGNLLLQGAAEGMDSLLDTVCRNAYRLEPELSKVGSDPNFWTQEELQLVFEKVMFWMM